MICYLVARLATLGEHRELLVEHPLELVGRHVGHALVGLQTLQLDQSEISIVSI